MRQPTDTENAHLDRPSPLLQTRWMKIALLLSLLLGFPVASAAGPSSRDFALMGRVAWSAFECSVLASLMKDPPEQKRLFFVGYEQGKAFLDALTSGSIQRQDVYEVVPWGVATQLEGPSAEFMLGRIYASAEDEAMKEVARSADAEQPEEARRAVARVKYLKANCALVGKGD